MEPTHLSTPSLSPSMKGQAGAHPASALWDLDEALTEASQNYSKAIFQVKMKRRKENLNPVSRGNTLNPHGSHKVPAHSSKAPPCSTGSSHSTTARPPFRQLLSKFNSSSAAPGSVWLVLEQVWALALTLPEFTVCCHSHSLCLSLIPSSNK